MPYFTTNIMLHVKQAKFILVVGLLSTTKGSTVTFEASPTILLEHLTKTSSMRCSLSQNALDASNIRHVTSISVTNNEDADVASVTAFDAPAALADPGNLQVKGSVDGEGYIQLSWSDAAHMTLGQYMCTIHGIDTNGHHLMLTSELSMTSQTPSVMDWIEDLNAKGQTQQLEIQRQNHEILQQHQESVMQQQEIQQLKHVLQSCSTNVAFMSAMSPSRFTSMKLTIQAGHTLIYDNTMLNIGGSYDNSTGMFTCVVTGVYSFQSHAMNANENIVALNMKVNAYTVASVYSGYTDDYEADSVTAVLHLNVGDVVKMVTTYTSTFHDQPKLRNSNLFSGYLLKAEGCQP